MRIADAPRALRWGGGLLALMTATGVLAPLVATDLPLLARSREGLFSPALRAALGGARIPAPAGVEVLIRAPIPSDPDAVGLGAILRPPSVEHPMGTDGLGRDVAARVVHGARTSLAVGFLAAAFSLLVGLPLGAWAGFRSGWGDAVVGRALEAALSVPSLLLALALLAAAPRWLSVLPETSRLALVLALTGWAPVARYLRGEFLRLRASDVVVAARAAGAGGMRVACLHVLPAALTPVLVTVAFSVAAAVLLEAALSFLGLGMRPPTASWGGILQEARRHLAAAWWIAVFPGACLFLAVLGCNLVAEGIRTALDPREARR
jgi:peptide/nickel transport system permease protein